MAFAKKRPEDLAERLAFAAKWLGSGVLSRTRGDYLRKDLAGDDILGAVAALWMAHRIAAREAETLPFPPRDEIALPIQIVF
jgi:predicted RNase H-like nuclease